MRMQAVNTFNYHVLRSTDMLNTLRLLGVALVVVCTAFAAHAEDTVQFNRDVRPILTNNCFRCHGPDAHERKKDLRFDQREVAVNELPDGVTAIVPGDPAASEMIKRITSDDPDYRMPPPEAHKTLTADQIDTLKKWVAQGAPYEKHWSLNTPTKPELPKVDNGDWPRNAIDHFVLDKLQAKGLSPEPTADKATLIRRVTFDLTGLPPTAEQVEAFVNDDSPDAYEKLVDRLLDSPHYGEHMARFWLDVIRYGDTHGLHLDNYREIWPYRDWVIRAFNDNIPYDEFTVMQLAGDLKKNPSQDDLIASGYNRMHVTTGEGGSIKEEVYVRNVIDRTESTATVFMGLTAGCAVCHDHKFDPISQKEFFQLFAFFNNLDANPMDGNKKAHQPVIEVPTEQQKKQLAEHNQQLAELNKKADAELAKVEYNDPLAENGDHELKREQIVWVDDELPPGADLQGDGLEWVDASQGPVHSGKRSMKRHSQGNQQHFFPTSDQPLRIGAGDKFFAWVYLDPENPPKEIMLQYHSSSWLHRAYWGKNLIPYGKDNTTQRKRLGNLPETGKWVRLEVDAAEIGIKPGTVITGMAFTQYDGISYWDKAGVETSANQQPQDYVWIDDETPSGAKLAGDGKSWQWVGDKNHPVHSGLRSLRRSMGDGLNQDYFTQASPPLEIHADDRLFAYVYLDPENPPKSVQLQFNSGKWMHRVRWGGEAHGAGRPDGQDYVASETIPETGKWVRLEVPIEKVEIKPGQKLNGWAFTQVGGTVYWDKAGVHTYFPPDDRHLRSLLVWQQKYGKDESVPKPVRDAIALATDKRKDKHKKTIRDYYLRHVYEGTRDRFDPINEQADQIKQKIAKLKKAKATTLVMKERPEPRDAFVLIRGEYDQKGEKVTRKTPEALPPMGEDLPRDRMGLAKWLIDRDHPLTARVAVNRFWQQCFGAGIVKTSEDFGSQGSPPSHPELLDYLAVQFIDDGWDIKKLMKRIVTSATYRQSAVIEPKKLEIDPANRLLARGPRFRLDAEMLRDQALKISGLLNEKMYGEPVKPPQPAGIWEAVGYTRSNTANFKADTGEKIFRRSVYSFWKRTAPPPPMTTFDAPSRESCTIRRERTNTPLQALVLMNEVQFVESARNLAQRAMLEAGDEPAQRAAFMYKRATAHDPSESELNVMLDAYRDHLATYRKDPSAARQLITYGQTEPADKLDDAELAAWTMVANLVMNLDETINKN